MLNSKNKEEKLLLVINVKKCDNIPKDARLGDEDEESYDKDYLCFVCRKYLNGPGQIVNMEEGCINKVFAVTKNDNAICQDCLSSYINAIKNHRQMANQVEFEKNNTNKIQKSNKKKRKI